MLRSALSAVALSFVLLGAAASQAARPSICQIAPEICNPGPVIVLPVLDVAIDRTSIDFGAVAVGTSAPAISVTVTNVGTAAFGPINIFGGAPPTPEFNASQNCQGTTLPSGGSCTVNYTFSPGTAGVFTDSSSFTISPTASQSDGEDFTVSLAGTGGTTSVPTAAAITVDRTSLDFGDVLVGGTATLSVTVKNTGSTSFGPLNIFGGAPVTAEFNASQNCQGTTLPAQGTCSITYSFSPTTPGSFSDSSVFTISATASQSDGKDFTVALTGTGLDGSTLCTTAPDTSCLAAAHASLVVDERLRGKEKLTARLSGFAEDTTQADFGDPVDGSTRYDICIYDTAGKRIAALAVARAGQLCGGPDQKPCWKAKQDRGWTYKDPAGSADGVNLLQAVSGPAGKGKLSLRASNDATHGESGLPTEIAAALQDAVSATIQLRASDGRCYSGALDTIGAADAIRFRAKSK